MNSFNFPDQIKRASYRTVSVLMDKTVMKEKSEDNSRFL